MPCLKKKQKEFTFIFNFDLCVHVFGLHAHLCTMCFQCSWRPKEGIECSSGDDICELTGRCLTLGF